MSEEFKDPFLEGNDRIEDAIRKMNQAPSDENKRAFADACAERMLADGHVLVATDPDEEEPESNTFAVVGNENGESLLAVFTNLEELRKQYRKNQVLSLSFDYLLEQVLQLPQDEIVINPRGDSLHLSKNGILALLERKNDLCLIAAAFDITKFDGDCIVNAANRTLLGGGGVDGAIHRAAGPELLEECRTLNGCETGAAKITGGYRLKAQYIIHTVGPVYSKSKAADCAQYLENCYWNCLDLAKKYLIHSIAFPAISTGVYGYPQDEAGRIAVKTCNKWLITNEEYPMKIVFSCFDDRTLDLYEKELPKVKNLRTMLRYL